MSQLVIRELTEKEEMLAHLEVIQYLYPNLSYEAYEQMLTDMLPNNYSQIAAFIGEQCVGISGCWEGTKLWCGKYIELDNVIVHPDYRSLGVGKLLADYLQQKAEASGCNILVLDAYTNNFPAHRFYYNQGYSPKGFHFVKILNKDGLT